MTEYEKLSLKLLLHIAQGIALSTAGATTQMVGQSPPSPRRAPVR